MLIEKRVFFFIWCFTFFLLIVSSLLFTFEISYTTIAYYAVVMLLFFLMTKAKIKLCKAFTQKRTKSKKTIFLFCFILGVTSCIPLLINNTDNFNKDISDIRDQHHSFSDSGKNFFFTLNFFLSPLLLIPFIYFNLYGTSVIKVTINVTFLLISLLFIFLTGGRVHFIIFGLLIFSIFLRKNEALILKHWKLYISKFLLCFMLLIIIGSTITLIRSGQESSNLLNYYYNLEHLKVGSASSISKTAFGETLLMVLVSSYDYTVQPIINYSTFLDNHLSVPRTYGFYQFNYLDRLQQFDFMKIHDKIDNIYYVKSGINYNVWGTAFREFVVDFGMIGSLIFFIFLVFLFKKSLKYYEIFDSSKILYAIIFSILIFSPFYSLLSIRIFSLTFLCALLWFANDLFFAKRSIYNPQSSTKK